MSSYVTTDMFARAIPAREVYEQFFGSSNTSLLSWVWDDPEHKHLAWVVGIEGDRYLCRIVPDALMLKHTLPPTYYANAEPIEEDEATLLRTESMSPMYVSTASFVITLLAWGILAFGIYIAKGDIAFVLPYALIGGAMNLVVPLFFHKANRSHIHTAVSIYGA